MYLIKNLIHAAMAKKLQKCDRAWSVHSVERELNLKEIKKANRDCVIVRDLLLFLLEKTVSLTMVKIFAPGKKFTKVPVFW